MSSESEELRTRVSALEAYLTGSADPALAAESLIWARDPEALLRRIQLLTEAERYGEAADTVRGLPPHPRWADYAISAFMASGDETTARSILDWAVAQDDEDLVRACRLAFARESVLLVEKAHSGLVVIPGDVTPAEAAKLGAAIEELAPVLAGAEHDKKLKNGIEVSAAVTALRAYYLLGAWADARRFAGLLATATPVPIQLAQAALVGLVEAPLNLPERLRAEARESFEAQLLASQVEAVLQGRPATALLTALGLVGKAQTEKDRTRLAAILSELVARSPREYGDAVDRAIEQLVGANSRFSELRKAERALESGSQDAVKKIEELRDDKDAVWLQLKAKSLELAGDVLGATETMVHAARLLPVPPLLWKAALRAYQNGLSSAAEELLQRLVRLEPNEIDPHELFAKVLLDSGQLTRASEQFRALMEIEPDVVTHAMNYAACLARSLDIEGSLRIYEHITSHPNAPAEAFLAHAQVMKTAGKPRAGLSLLRTVAEKFKDVPQFVLALLDLSYAAGEDDVGSGALLQMRRLKEAGKVGEDIFRSLSLDELVEHARDQQEMKVHTAELVSLGRMPWVMCDNFGRWSPYLGWTIRTQPIEWIADDRVSRALLTVYSTNGYVAKPASDASGRFELESLPEASGKQAVAMDVSAIITLHRLGILEDAINFFGQVVVPESYFGLALRERTHLVQHQPSIVAAWQLIRKQIDLGIIGISPDTSLPLVDEHAIEGSDGRSYGICDLADVLQTSPVLTEEQLKKLRAFPPRPVVPAPDRPALARGSKLRLRLSTLEALAQHGLLDPLLGEFTVNLDKGEYEELTRNLTGGESTSELMDWHHDLWDRMRQNSKVERAGYRIKRLGEHEDSVNPGSGNASLLCAMLAVERKIPLVADDRVLQALYASESGGSRNVFGSDLLLAGMSASGQLDVERHANSILELIRWRYRFLVVPSSVLQTVASRFRGRQPGRDLQNISRYVHDCMRDPGLSIQSVGAHQNDTPANRFYLEWIGVLAEFVVKLWVEQASGVADAEALTSWVITECMPSPPRFAAPQVVDGTFRLFLGKVLISGSTVTERERVSQALVYLRTCAGLSDREYARAVTEVLDAF
jgi:tetratricopeptide (TPR) repeat protein